jgi:hypothetical protein
MDLCKKSPFGLLGSIVLYFPPTPFEVRNGYDLLGFLGQDISMLALGYQVPVSGRRKLIDLEKFRLALRLAVSLATADREFLQLRDVLGYFASQDGSSEENPYSDKDKFTLVSGNRPQCSVLIGANSIAPDHSGR